MNHDEELEYLRKQNSILLGQLDTLKINLNHYKKKVIEYEAKVKAFDRIVEQRKGVGAITLGHYAWHIIEKYENGGYEAKNDEVDHCTKCTVKPIAKEHMCEECYTEHNELRELSASKQDIDQWYTLYESGVRG